MSVKVENLSVAYRMRAGDVCPVEGVSFTVADGEIMGLAGESGCGKSTLGNSLVFMEGRMRHLGGRVVVDGQALPVADFRAMRPYRMTKVSLVPQYAMNALNPTRRIGRLTTDLLRSHDVRESDVLEEMKRRIRLIGLDEGVLNRYSFELSGGMRQRVTIILSTLLNPSLLVADEVTSALDVSTQRAVGEMLMEFRDRGFVKSVIAITHDLSILAQIADSILVMYAGRLAEKASAADIVNAPLHPYTQMLLASLPEVGVRYDKVTLTGIPAVRRRWSTRRAGAASPTAARSPGPGAPRHRRSNRYNPAVRSPAGRSARGGQREAQREAEHERPADRPRFQVLPGQRGW